MYTDSVSYFVYIVECADTTLYTGITTDVEKRIQEHNHADLGAKYTRSRRPVQLVYSEPATDRSAAAKREWEIKQLTRVQKQQLCGRQ